MIAIFKNHGTRSKKNGKSMLLFGSAENECDVL